MLKRLTITYLIFQVAISLVFSQENYPIYVTPTLIPPYSLKLSDYCKFGSQNLMVMLTVKDLEVSNIPVKLRISMETAGILIENPITTNTTPIYLDGGTTTVLFGEDLVDYFNIDNLIFKGYSKETYKQTGQLPEGFYKFTIEVLHFQTNKLISNLGTTTAWIAVGKPPVLKLPLDNTQLGQYKGMPLIFTWLPSNVGSPVSTGSIQYKFEMWEMRIAGIPAYTVAASIPVFHEYTTFNTTYTLYTDALLMEPGMQYAWRVTASDVSGFVPFEQDGHSEVRTFTYKCQCDSVSDLSSSYKGTTGIYSWTPDERHTSFNVEMRNPLTGWYSKSETYENKAEFYDLNYGTTYQLRVQSVCDGDASNTSDFTQWKSLKIPEPKPLYDSASCPGCGCNDSIPDTEISNFNLRDDLKAGDTLVNKTGTTRFILKSVEPVGNGTYKGIFLFWAEIWKMKFVCEYWDLQVNTDNVIVNMDFESVYNPQFLVDVDATIDYLNNLADAINELTVNTTISDTLAINIPVTSIYVNSGDSVMAVTIDENGNVHETLIHDNVDDLSRTLIQGENGEEYVVTRDGEVMGVDEYKNTGGDDQKIEELKEDNETNKLSSDETLNFIASNNQQYGFDSYNEIKSALQSEYPSLQNGYKAPFKSVASYSTDKVGFSEVNGDVSFKDEMGIPALKSGQELTIRGSAGGSEMALYAWKATSDSTEQIIGKLNILSYDEQIKRVIIVPVNGAKIPDPKVLQDTLNRIYSQAVTQWNVSLPGGLDNVVFENGNMTHGGTSIVSTYNADQKAIVNAYEAQYGKLESEALYLFFVENVQFKERSIAGYMPLQRQAGFIYGYPSPNIVSHELGHGAFNLYHTFSDENFIAAEQTTNNLMDYKGGTELWKHQWNNIHDPENILFAFLQGEKEGEQEIEDFFAVSTRDDYSKNEEGYATFFSPANLPITIKPTGGVDIVVSLNTMHLKPLYISKDPNDLVENSSEENNPNYRYIKGQLPIGVLFQFTENGKTYIADIDNENNIFLGYKESGTENYKFDNITISYSTPYYVNCINESGGFYQNEQEKYLSEYSLDQYKAASIPKEDVEIKVTYLTDVEYNALVSKLVERLNNQINQKQYFTVDEPLNLNLYNDQFNKDDLNDRFLVYNKETSDQIFADVIKVKGRPTDEQFRNLAKDVYQQSIAVVLTNTVYLVVPVWEEIHTSKTDVTINHVFSKSFYSGNENINIISESVAFNSQSDNIYKEIKAFYKLIPKPLIEYYHFVRVDGLDLYKEVIRKEKVAGEEHIYKLLYFYDKQITDFLELEDAYIAAKSQHEVRKLTDNDNSIDEIQKAANELAEWFRTSMDIKVQNPQWVNGYSDLEEAYLVNHVLKESFVPENHSEYVNNCVNAKFNGFIWKENLKEIESIAFFNPDYGEVIYAAIDGVGVVLSLVDLDIVADATGSWYARYRGDSEQKNIYDASIVLPFVAAPLLKKLVKEGKVILRYDDEVKSLINVGEELINTEGRQSWNGFANIFYASSNEISEATTRIANHRSITGNLKGGNYGYIDGAVNGDVVDNKLWRSGQALESEPQIFQAIEVEGAGGNSWLRTTDSEYKMLNQLAEDLGGVVGNTYPKITGELKIVSENSYCVSCQGIIQQFNEMFPNIKLILIDGAK